MAALAAGSPSAVSETAATHAVAAVTLNILLLWKVMRRTVGKRLDRPRHSAR